MKDGAQGDEFTSRLEVVEIGLDDDGEKITSCVVASVEGATAARGDSRQKLTKGAKIALDALHEAIGELGEVPAVSNHIPGGVKCATIDQWREYALRRGINTSDKESGPRMAFARATETLLTAHRVAIWDGHAWAVGPPIPTTAIAIPTEVAPHTPAIAATVNPQIATQAVIS